jgi:hypothetical protein
MVPPTGLGCGGRIIGLAAAMVPPTGPGCGGRIIGLLSANAMAETVENTKSAARRKVENDDI